MEKICKQKNFRCVMNARRARYFPIVAAATLGVYYWHDKRLFMTYSTMYAKNSDDGESWYSKLIKSTTERASLSDQFMSSILKKQEFRFDVKKGPISWFETNHYNANNPIEDRHCECVFANNNSFLFGIFDGHSGWHCSESLRLRLPLYVSLALTSTTDRKRYLSKELRNSDLVTYLGNPDDDCLSFQLPETFQQKQEEIQSGPKHFTEKGKDVLPTMGVEDALKYAYLSLDRDITREAIPDGKCNEAIWTGLSGAVAVSAYVKDNDVYVANTGDCRVIMGTKSNGSWIPYVMSEDHNDDNIEEVKRLTRQHPGEKSVIFRGRLLGQLQPLRAFGDIAYKWSVELHRKVLDLLYGRPIVPEVIYLTPPYLTAQPDVLHKEITSDDRFLILATDGLWDTVSNEMAVKIVGDYLDEVNFRKKIEENASTRLIRFALGGGSNTRLSEVMQIPENLKRNFHDDITVTVVFFSDPLKKQSKL